MEAPALVRWLLGSAEVDPCLVMVRPKIEQLPLEFAAGYRQKDIGGIPVARPTGLTLREAKAIIEDCAGFPKKP